MKTNCVIMHNELAGFVKNAQWVVSIDLLFWRVTINLHFSGTCTLPIDIQLVTAVAATGSNTDNYLCLYFWVILP